MVVTLCEVKPSDILQNIPFASLVGSYIFRTLEPRGPNRSERDFCVHNIIFINQNLPLKISIKN